VDWILLVLSTLQNPDLLEVLALEIQTKDNSAPIDDWKRIDIPLMSFTRLRQVFVGVNQGTDPSKQEQILRELPLLRKRGVLRVFDVQGEDEEVTKATTPLLSRFEHGDMTGGRYSGSRQQVEQTLTRKKALL
jgi:hypothetical protein